MSNLSVNSLGCEFKMVQIKEKNLAKSLEYSFKIAVVNVRLVGNRISVALSQSLRIALDYYKDMCNFDLHHCLFVSLSAARAAL